MRSFVSFGGAVFVLLTATELLRAETIKETILRLSKEYDAAIRVRDSEALDQLFDDDGQFVDTEGRLLNEREYIEQIVDDDRAFETAEASAASS